MGEQPDAAGSTEDVLPHATRTIRTATRRCMQFPAGEIALPTYEQLHQVLAVHADGPSLAELEKVAAMFVDAAKRRELPHEQLFEITEWHLQVKRKLGTILAGVDNRGGNRSKSRAAPLPNGGLPSGLNKSAARRYRQLARICDETFSRYVETVARSLRLPSASGAVGFAATEANAARNPSARPDPDEAARTGLHQRRRSAVDVPVEPEVFASLERGLGDVEVCFGSAPIRCRHRLTDANPAADNVRGTVVITSPIDPSLLLPRIKDLHSVGRCFQAVAFLNANTSARWFDQLANPDWSVCFLADCKPSVIAAYVGSRAAAFAVSMRPHGVVMRSRH